MKFKSYFDIILLRMKDPIEPFLNNKKNTKRMPREEKKPAACPENEGNEKSKFHFLKTNTD